MGSEATREQLQQFAEDLYCAHSEARIEGRPDFDPAEEWYFADWKTLSVEERRLWWRVAEKLVGQVRPAVKEAP